MQLGLFTSAGSVQIPVAPVRQQLVSTPLPSLEEALQKLGQRTNWESRTVSEIHELWYTLYNDYVAVLDEPIAFAKPYGKAGHDAYLSADERTRHHFKVEYARLKAAQGQIRAAIESTYLDRLISFTDEARAQLQSLGCDQEEVACSDEFFSEAFRQPGAHELGITMPQFMAVLVREYAGMSEAEPATAD